MIVLSIDHIKHHILKLTYKWAATGLTANVITAILQEPPDRIVEAYRQLIAEKKLRPTWCFTHAGTYVWPQFGDPEARWSLGYNSERNPIPLDKAETVLTYISKAIEEKPGALWKGAVSETEWDKVLNRLAITPNKTRAKKRKDCLVCEQFPYKGKEK